MDIQLALAGRQATISVLLECRAFLVWNHVLEQSNERKTRGTGNVCRRGFAKRCIFHFQEMAELANQLTLMHVEMLRGSAKAVMAVVVLWSSSTTATTSS